MRIVITVIMLSFMFTSTVLAKPQGGPGTKAECSLIGGTFTYLGGDMTSCCTDKGCTICDLSGCHFDEAMGGKNKGKKSQGQKELKMKPTKKELKDLIKERVKR